MYSETELVVALRRRDQKAFSYLFDTYSDRIYRLAFSLLKHEDEAESIVQDTFLRLFEKLEQFQGKAKLGTWLYRVAYNGCMDTLRRRQPTTPLTDEPDEAAELPIPTVLVDWCHAPEVVFASTEAEHELEQAIEQLPEKYRTVFMLRDIEGFSIAETSEILGLSSSAVKVRLHRARLRLREQLSVYFSERLSQPKGVA